MAKTLEAHDKLIREIFEGSYQFEIPDYQRPYAWTTEQATELFDDLYSAMQDARVSGASSQYFLGSMQTFKSLTDPTKLNRKPERIHLKTVANAGTLEQVLRGYNMPAPRLNELAVLNGMNLTDRVVQGTIIKIVGE